MYMCMCFFSNVRICPYIPVAFNFLYERECVSYIFYTCIVCVCVSLVESKSYPISILNRFPNTMECECAKYGLALIQMHARTHAHTAIRLIIQSKFVCFIR